MIVSLLYDCAVLRVALLPKANSWWRNIYFLFLHWINNVFSFMKLKTPSCYLFCIFIMMLYLGPRDVRCDLHWTLYCRWCLSSVTYFQTMAFSLALYFAFPFIQMSWTPLVFRGVGIRTWEGGGAESSDPSHNKLHTATPIVLLCVSFTTLNCKQQKKKL